MYEFRVIHQEICLHLRNVAKKKIIFEDYLKSTTAIHSFEAIPRVMVISLLWASTHEQQLTIVGDQASKFSKPFIRAEWQLVSSPVMPLGKFWQL